MKNRNRLSESRIPIKQIENSLTPTEMKNIVRESGGQQTIFPKNINLYNWAVRVARSRVNESYFDIANAEHIYEKFGGSYFLLEASSANKVRGEAKKNVTQLFTKLNDHKGIFHHRYLLHYEDLVAVERVIRNYYNEYMKPMEIGFMLNEHFFERINSTRNKRPIEKTELMTIFKMAIEPLRDIFITGDLSNKFGKKTKITCLCYDVSTKINIAFEILSRSDQDIASKSLLDPKYSPFATRQKDGTIKPRDFNIRASTIKRDYKFYPRTEDDGTKQAEFMIETGLPEYTGNFDTNLEDDFVQPEGATPTHAEKEEAKRKSEEIRQYMANTKTSNDYRGKVKNEHPKYEHHPRIEELVNKTTLSASYTPVFTLDDNKPTSTKTDTTSDTALGAGQSQNTNQNSQDPRVPSQEEQDKIMGIEKLWTDPESPFLTDADDEYKCLKSGDFWDKVFKFLADKKNKTQESFFVKNRFMRPVNEEVVQPPSFKELARVSYITNGKLILQPKNKSLFDWATRVAKSKFESFTKQELFSGVLYERYGGIFSLLPANKLKKLTEGIESSSAGITDSDLADLEHYVDSRINTHLHLKGRGQVATFVFKDHFVDRTYDKRNMEPISSELLSEYFDTIIGIINQYVSRVTQIKKDTEKFISILFYDRTSKVNVVIRVYYCEGYRLRSKFTNRRTNTALTVVGTTMKRDKEWNEQRYNSKYQTDQFKHIIDLPDNFLYDGDFEEFTGYSTTDTSFVDKDIERINAQRQEFEKTRAKPTFPKLSLKKK